MQRDRCLSVTVSQTVVVVNILLHRAHTLLGCSDLSHRKPAFAQRAQFGPVNYNMLYDYEHIQLTSVI